MKYEIKSSYNSSLLISVEAESLKAAIELAVSHKADLSRADLSRADLSGTNLSEADLSWANLSWSDLSRANLSGANLSEADLSGANLSGANLSRAKLSGANLYRADLCGTDLSKANLSGADLDKTILDPNNNANQKEIEKFEPLDDSWVFGYRTRYTSAAGRSLINDRIYGCEVFSTCQTECHPGWYLWPSLKEAEEYSGPEHEFIKVKSRKIDIHKAGSKWRSKTIWILGTVE